MSEGRTSGTVSEKTIICFSDDSLKRSVTGCLLEIHKLKIYLQRAREQVVLWQGKHAMVKHENNVLRRKVRQLQGRCDGQLFLLGEARKTASELYAELQRNGFIGMWADRDEDELKETAKGEA